MQHKNYFIESKSFNVDVPAWNGPLELLLDLIRKSEINIFDIPISQITEDYLQAIHSQQKIDVDVAANFLEMAATLIIIKSKMLLPANADEHSNDAMENDPREALVQQLLEYQKYKEIANELDKKQNEADFYQERWKAHKHQQLTFPLVDELLKKDKKSADISSSRSLWQQVSIYDLLKVFSNVVRLFESEQNLTPTVQVIEYSVEDSITHLKSKLDEKHSINFYDLFLETRVKEKIIATFWAILQLYKENYLTIKQHAVFGDIYLFKI